MQAKIDTEKYSHLSDKINSEKQRLDLLLTSISSDDTEVEQLIENGLKCVVDFASTFERVDIHEKRKMLSSMFPEKMKIFNDTPRTPRLNSTHLVV